MFYIKVLLCIVLALECCSHMLNYALRWISLVHEEGKIICAPECSMMRSWLSPFLGQWLVASPGVAMLACIYTGMVIYIAGSVLSYSPLYFWLPAGYELGCWAGKCCYYFIWCIKAVPSSFYMYVFGISVSLDILILMRTWLNILPSINHFNTWIEKNTTWRERLRRINILSLNFMPI